MSAAPSISQQPEVNLLNWVVLQLPDGRRFFMGEVEGSEERIRTSTPIRQFDDRTMTGTTQSGRVYHLVGAPRPDPKDDFSIKLAARLIGLDLDRTTVVEMKQAVHLLH